MAANEEILSKIHKLMWEQIAARLEAGETLTAAEIGQIMKGLKDNGINCDGMRNPAVGRAAEYLPFPTQDEDEVANG